MSQKNRQAYILQLHTLLLARHGSAANDLPKEQDPFSAAGVPRAPRAPRQQRAPAEGEPATKKAKKGAKELRNEYGDVWFEDDEFVVAAIVSTKCSEGKDVRGGS